MFLAKWLLYCCNFVLNVINVALLFECILYVNVRFQGCFTDSFVTPMGAIRYRLGCRDRTVRTVQLWFIWMDSFNKTEAAVFLMQAVLPEGFPFSQLIYLCFIFCCVLDAKAYSWSYFNVGI